MIQCSYGFIEETRQDHSELEVAEQQKEAVTRSSKQVTGTIGAQSSKISPLKSSMIAGSLLIPSDCCFEVRINKVDKRHCG